MTTSSAATDQQNVQPSTFGERLAFAIWLGGKVLGVESAKDFAEAIGKGQPQLSRWLREDPRPAWPTIKQIADAVRISALWLDDPASRGAIEPEDFAQWLENRRARAARSATAAEHEAPPATEVKRGAKQSRGTPAVKSTDVRKRA